MLKRYPVPPDSRPCGKPDDYWQGVKSLAVLAEEARSELLARGAVDEDGDIRWEEAFIRAHRKHLGFAPPKPERFVPQLIRVARYTRQRGYDFALWLEAQLLDANERLKLVKKRSGMSLSFQPHMLIGEQAEARYLSFVHAVKQRNGVVRENAFEWADEEKLRRLIRDLADGIEYAIRVTGRGERITLLAATRQRGAAEVLQQVDVLCFQVRRYVLLAAAVTALEMIRMDWSCRFGCKEPLNLEELIRVAAGCVTWKPRTSQKSRFGQALNAPPLPGNGPPRHFAGCGGVTAWVTA